MKEKLYVGIDLGTTNSECFIKAGNNKMQPLCITEALDTCMLNSIVRKDEKGNYIVGNRLKSADKYKTSWKLLKTHLDKNLTYDVNGNLTNDNDPLGIKPSLFSTKILQVIKNEIDSQYSPAQYEIENLVITVPANFRDTARRIVKQAALDAGFVVTGEFKLINEPTSAAVAYGQGNEQTLADQKVIAYDLGGGTFDVTLLDYIKDEEGGCNFYQAISTDGKNIGGKDFDRCIIDIIFEKFLTENPIYKGDSSFKGDFYSKLLFEAENAKIFLSKRNLYAQVIDIVVDNKNISVDISITRDEFKKAIEHLVDETIELTKAAISGYEDTIGSIILIGGSTKVPFVKEKLMEAFDYKILDNGNPDLIVAEGACYHASSIGKNLETSSVMLNEVLSNGIFTNVVGNLLSLSIAPGSAIPCHVEQGFIAEYIDQDELAFIICNGKGTFIEEDTVDIIGSLTIKNLKHEGKRPEVTAIYDVTEDELISVTIVSKSDPRNKVSTQFKINSSRNDIKNEKIAKQNKRCEYFIKKYTSFNYEKQYTRLVNLINEANSEWDKNKILRKLEESRSNSLQFKIMVIRLSEHFDRRFFDNYIDDLYD